MTSFGNKMWGLSLFLGLINPFVISNISVEIQRFEQPIKDDGTLKFLVIGDWGREGDFNQSQVAFQMGRIGEEIDIDFVVSTGDNFYDDGLKGVNDPNFLNSFTNVYTAKSLQKPWYSVLGNHDYRGNAMAQLSPFLRKMDERWICLRSFIVNAEYFRNPEDHVYDWRNVIPPKRYTSKALKDLELALKESRAHWKVVVGHHAIKSVGHHGDTQELVQLLLPILQANNVDFYMNGHDHCLEHISDYKSPIQFFTSGAGSKAWRGDIKNLNGEDLKFFYDGQGFMSVELTQTEVKILLYDVYGRILHGWTRIGPRSSVGPYALLQKGTVVEDGDEVLALSSGGANCETTTANVDDLQKGKKVHQIISKNHEKYAPIIHLFGIYAIGFLGSLSAAMSYFIHLWILQKPPTHHQFAFFCISGAFHWLPYTIVAYTMIFDGVPSNPISFSISTATAYITYGLILSFSTCLLKSYISAKQDGPRTPIKTWFLHRIVNACHLRFAKFLSGTEALCSYLRYMGAKVGQHCSVRAINAVSDPELISLADGVHLGDFSRIIPGYYTSSGYIAGEIEIQDNSIVGSQGVILPGSVLEKDVILGALSVAPRNSVLQRGGVFVGSTNPVMVKNTMHSFDDRIDEMDMKYKKVLGNLAANFAGSTLKVSSRFFHRIGAAGKGSLRFYDHIPGLPDHRIFSPGKHYSIIMRHSNCLSSDDDARLDPRGAAIRILSNNPEDKSPLLDLTLKTGNAFHARTIGDFAVWLICGAAAREEHVKHAPHIRDAMWDSLRRAESYTTLHYYSNICRLFRFEGGQEMYVKFKLRPFDKKFGEDTGKVEPMGILPPETGAIPRDESDKRPLLFLADDFQKRVNSPEKVCYVLQLQIRPVPDDEMMCEIALDCTKPWDETEFPHFDVGEITIDQVLSKEESEALEFNPFLKCPEIDVIRASSCNQSASMDHGRSVVYAICQHLRNKRPLPEAWRSFLDQSDVKVNLSACPMAAALEKKVAKDVTLARPWYVNLWMMSAQPFLQTFLPYFLLGLVVFAPLKLIFYLNKISKVQMHWLLPFFWLCSGILAGVLCAVSKWILVGRKKEGDIEPIWSKRILMDTTWQAIRTLVGEYFMEMTSGSFFYGIWMKLMGSNIAWDRGVYVDSMGAVLNPELIEIREYGSIEREALLFGHIYEGEGGKVKYGKIVVEQGGFVGSRAVAMPGVTVGTGGSLGALSLAMKEEFIN